MLNNGQRESLLAMFERLSNEDLEALMVGIGLRLRGHEQPFKYLGNMMIESSEGEILDLNIPDVKGIVSLNI